MRRLLISIELSSFSGHIGSNSHCYLQYQRSSGVELGGLRGGLSPLVTSVCSYERTLLYFYLLYSLPEPSPSYQFSSTPLLRSNGGDSNFNILEGRF